MFLTVHAAAAVVISETISSRVAGFIIGIISHLILDFFPHGDYGLERLIKKKPEHERLRTMIAGLIDIAVMFAMSLWIITYIPLQHPEVAVWTAFGAILPDLIWGLHSITGKKIKILGWISHWHHTSQQYWKDTLSLKTGFAIQIVFLAILFWIQQNVL